MPTIAEVIAAKRAAASAAVAAEKPVTYAAATSPEEIELTAAIDRIDPPRRKSMVLSKGPLPAVDVAEKAHHAELRSLSRASGEAIPMVPVSADRETSTWHEALNSFESSLCVMRDQHEPEVIWLAVRAEREGLPPILLHRLPWTLWDHPSTQSDDQPF